LPFIGLLLRRESVAATDLIASRASHTGRHWPPLQSAVSRQSQEFQPLRQYFSQPAALASAISDVLADYHYQSFQ